MNITITLTFKNTSNSMLTSDSNSVQMEWETMLLKWHMTRYNKIVYVHLLSRRDIGCRHKIFFLTYFNR